MWFPGVVELVYSRGGTIWPHVIYVSYNNVVDPAPEAVRPHSYTER